MCTHVLKINWQQYKAATSSNGHVTKAKGCLAMFIFLSKKSRLQVFKSWGE